jgi:hypothetical protein
MIITETIKMKIAPNNYNYWKNKGYEVSPTGGRGGRNTGQIIEVLVKDLSDKSNVIVECKCNSCEKEYKIKYSNNTSVCYTCRQSIKMKHNKLGKANKGKIVLKMRGRNHPNFNHNKTAYREYIRLVRQEERKHDLSILENFDKQRGRCGVSGAYQLDHKISIKNGFNNTISPEIIGHINNLQIIPWELNRQKWHK